MISEDEIVLNHEIKKKKKKNKLWTLEKDDQVTVLQLEHYKLARKNSMHVFIHLFFFLSISVRQILLIIIHNNMLWTFEGVKNSLTIWQFLKILNMYLTYDLVIYLEKQKWYWYKNI